MQTLTFENVRHEQRRKATIFSISKWYEKNEATFEMNRFGLTAALVLLQVSIAGFNVVIPALAGASVWIMAPGIAMAFLSNSIAFAQMNMKWVLTSFGLSMFINAAISLYFLIQVI